MERERRGIRGRHRRAVRALGGEGEVGETWAILVRERRLSGS
jgi:hypothetical protein